MIQQQECITCPNYLRERDIDLLRLIATGDTNQSAADKLHYTVFTIKQRLRILRIKFDACTTTELVYKATLFGVI